MNARSLGVYSGGNSDSENAPSPSVYSGGDSDSENDSLFDKLLEDVSSNVCFRGESMQSKLLRDNEQTLGHKPEPMRQRWNDVRQAANDLWSTLKDVRRRMEIEKNKWMANCNAF
ncbi:hypothetical protein O9K51_10704 [Purpureocillium lavendulum]|uniref:Uncharacterized protein n=1 Tax=Purpureocillium lavendulum TaxID=1247861 RepID=A0AB34FEH7_9HYPO|nr:hypothetical protein O9K51_10704 [Purpureocillium lavendulum]